MTVLRVALMDAARLLAEAGVADADREAGWLLAHVIGCSAGSLRVRFATELAAAALAEFTAVVERRARREPIQYILGTEEFMGMTFSVTPAVLIPRPDTETLVQQAVARLQGLAAGAEPIRVADIGTGSGAIAIAVAVLLPGATLVAVDLSPAALEVAAANAAANGVAARVEFRQGNLLEPLRGERFDAILSNPPYIAEDELPGLMPEVRLWEPRVALTPGPDGIDCFRRLLVGAPDVLTPRGLLGVEVGLGQAEVVRQLFREADFTAEGSFDRAGIERAILGHRV